MNPNSLKSVPSSIGNNTPSEFQNGECGLVTIGGVHMHATVNAVRFTSYGKVLYDVYVEDSVGMLELTVPSERLNRSMETMPDYGPASKSAQTG